MLSSAEETIETTDLLKIWEWNCAVPASVERCIHEMIGEQSQPTAPAVCAWDGTFTYGELNYLATQLSSRLVSMGAGPETTVPLCFEKSRWATVAMLAVLKAGCNFVALDPALPELRLTQIVRQVQPNVLLTSCLHQALGARLVDVVIVVSPDAFTTQLELIAPIKPAGPTSIAYVTFTSGSTGTPKGVVIEHRNVASALHHQTDRLGITAKSRFFDFASYSYDVSCSNTLAVLLAGGCICVPSDEDRINNIAGSITSLGANITALTPSVSRLLSPEAVPGLQSLILVGEPVRTSDITRWQGRARVICRYGVSESPAASTIHAGSSDHPCIGTGAGLVTWVASSDNHNVLVPLGAVGELLLEGPAIARGYLNDAVNTTAAFIHDPKWLTTGGRSGRLYKTGDLVRYQMDGSLIFVGRKDTQVKIRGQRVELEDIEYHVQECLSGMHQLVAEVVMLPGPVSRPSLVVFVAE